VENFSQDKKISIAHSNRAVLQNHEKTAGKNFLRFRQQW
jgi:hypothetical protein